MSSCDASSSSCVYQLQLHLILLLLSHLLFYLRNEMNCTYITQLYNMIVKWGQHHQCVWNKWVKSFVYTDPAVKKKKRLSLCWVIWWKQTNSRTTGLQAHTWRQNAEQLMCLRPSRLSTSPLKSREWAGRLTSELFNMVTTGRKCFNKIWPWLISLITYTSYLSSSDKQQDPSVSGREVNTEEFVLHLGALHTVHFPASMWF